MQDSCVSTQLCVVVPKSRAFVWKSAFLRGQTFCVFVELPSCSYQRALFVVDLSCHSTAAEAEAVPPRSSFHGKPCRAAHDHCRLISAIGFIPAWRPSFKSFCHFLLICKQTFTFHK